MPTWVRVLVAVTTLVVWVVVVGAILAQGKLPDVAMLGLPAGVVTAMAPPWPTGKVPLPKGRAKSR